MTGASRAIELRPASSLSRADLARVFTEGFEEYFVPVRVDEAALGAMVESFDLDLDASRVAFVDDRPAGLVLLGFRDDEAWIGGMGVRVADRRRGLGIALMDAVLAEARTRSTNIVRLEVIDANTPAITLYEKLGFRLVRNVEVWTLDAALEPASADEVDVDDALATIGRLRTAPEPWQRADGTVRQVRRQSRPLRAYGGDDGAVVVRTGGPMSSILQIAAVAEEVAERLLRAVRSLGPPVHVLNLPTDQPAAAALRSLGGRVDVRQRELALAL